MTTISEFAYLPRALPLARLGELLPPSKKLPPPPSSKSLDQWRMEDDDAPIFQYLYQTHLPRRHLEFGTWQGWGASLCMESCPATVWTINLPGGESKPNGEWAYGERVLDTGNAPRDIETATTGKDKHGPITLHRTDAGGYIGRIYRERGLGNRVCQVFCDSREWDTSNYPSDFFDSVLIDGGHQSEVVVSDTQKALQVLRPGGLIMWHDFCPIPAIRSQFASVSGVTAGIDRMLPDLQLRLTKLHWVNPSWILVGIKK